MIYFLLAVGSGLVFLLGLYFIVITRLAPRTRTRQRMRTLRAATATTEEARRQALDVSRIPFGERVLLPFFRWLEKNLGRFAPRGIYAMLERHIMLAGKSGVWSVNAFATMWVISILGFGFLMFFLNMESRAQMIQKAMMIMMGLVFGGALPFMFLRTLIDRRKQEIMRQLPEVLDLLSVSVQAGLSFDGGLANITERMKGAFPEECDRLLQDIRIGMTRRDALRAMAARCDLQDVSLFVTSIIQAEQLGASISQTLVMQAANIRERRRLYVRGEALKAPIKILFPLILFIFPALLVVIGVPIALSLMKAFSNMGS